MYNSAGNWTNDMLKDECLQIEADNDFNRNYNERLEKRCELMEAYAKRCDAYVTSYKNALVDCGGCKRKVHHRSASTSLKSPNCANRKPISRDAPAFPPVSEQVIVLTKLMEGMSVHDEQRIRMANWTTRLGYLRDEQKAINKKFRDVIFNHDLLTKYAFAWKVYMNKVISSPLHCPHCCARVRIQNCCARVRIQKRAIENKTKTIKTEVKTEV